MPAADVNHRSNDLRKVWLLGLNTVKTTGSMYSMYIYFFKPQFSTTNIHIAIMSISSTYQFWPSIQLVLVKLDWKMCLAICRAAAHTANRRRKWGVVLIDHCKPNDNYSWSTGTISQGASPDSKVHGANMGPIWGRQDPGGHHVGPMNFAIWEVTIWLKFIDTGNFLVIVLGI